MKKSLLMLPKDNKTPEEILTSTTFIAPKSCLRDIKTFINKIRNYFLKNRETTKN
jgi:hypothetical protein